MDWKFALGTLGGTYVLGIGLAMQRPRVYQAISGFVTNGVAWVGLTCLGVWGGATITAGLAQDAVATKLPSMPPNTANDLLASTEQFTAIAGWSVAFMLALAAGHIACVFIAHLSNQDDKKKGQQPNG